MAPAATSAGTLSAAGEALQRLPAMVARPWTCVEPMRLAASTTPGQAFFSSACLAESAPETAAPILKPPFFGDDLPHAVDLLDVDDEVRLEPAGFHLDQKVGAAGEDTGMALLAAEQLHRLVDRLRGFVSHACSRFLGFLKLDWAFRHYL